MAVYSIEEIDLAADRLFPGQHIAIGGQIILLIAGSDPAGLHLGTIEIEVIPFPIDLFPACHGIEIFGHQIVPFPSQKDPAFREITGLRL